MVAELSALSLSSGSVVGQSQPTATITLTAAAPSGGAVIRLETTNSDVAKIPGSTITIAAGATSTTFRVDTATVPTRTTVTLTATYAGIAKTADLIVTLPTPRASFTVTSPTKGTDACLLIDQGDQLDCRLDARASLGVLTRWSWLFTAADRQIANRTEATYGEIDTGGCPFVEDAPAKTDDQGRYVDMTIQLEVQDRDGSQSPAVTRSVKLYTNDYCGF